MQPRLHHRSSAFRRLASPSPHTPCKFTNVGLPPPTPVPPMPFLTTSATRTLHNFPGCHPSSDHGVLRSSGVFPPANRSPSPASIPSCRSPAPSRGTTQARLQGFAPRGHPSPPTHRSGLDPLLTSRFSKGFIPDRLLPEGNRPSITFHRPSAASEPKSNHHKTTGRPSAFTARPESRSTTCTQLGLPTAQPVRNYTGHFTRGPS